MTRVRIEFLTNRAKAAAEAFISPALGNARARKDRERRLAARVQATFRAAGVSQVDSERARVPGANGAAESRAFTMPLHRGAPTKARDMKPEHLRDDFATHAGTPLFSRDSRRSRRVWARDRATVRTGSHWFAAGSEPPRATLLGPGSPSVPTGSGNRSRQYTGRRGNVLSRDRRVQHPSTRMSAGDYPTPRDNAASLTHGGFLLVADVGGVARPLLPAGAFEGLSPRRVSCGFSGGAA